MVIACVARLIIPSENSDRVMQNPERIAYEGCPLCDAGGAAHLITADCSKHPLYQPSLSPVMTWLKCVECDHVFTDGYFTDEAAGVIFSRTNAGQRVGADCEKWRYISARMIEKVLPYVDDRHWLDVGFGNGSLLFTAEEYGFSPVGLDLRTENVAALRAMGIEAHCLDILKLDQPGRYRVVSMADVLEHIPYPIPALKAAHALLQDGGVLFLSMPNMDSRIWRILSDSRANPYWGEIEHYHNFSRTRLYRLLQANGFEPVRYGVSERYRSCMEVVAKKRAA